MTFADTGPLVALVNENDPYHQAARDAAASLPPTQLLTTWPVLTESMYLPGRATGFVGQESLWTSLERGKIVLHDAASSEVTRMSELMATYRDTPMDLADASLVAAAEATGLRDIFTFDAHFRIYRLNDGSFLNVIP